jgi:hypothetical protein
VGYMIICTALVFLMIPGVGYVCAVTHWTQCIDDHAVSSTLISQDASQPSRSSGSRSWLPLSFLSSGSSGATRLLSLTEPASSSVLLTTSAS